MALLEHQLQAINQLAEALSSNELRKLVYLCECSDSDTSVAYVKDLLKSKMMQHQNNPLFLPELVLHLGRYDLLRSIFNVSRDEVGHRQVLPSFR